MWWKGKPWKSAGSFFRKLKPDLAYDLDTTPMFTQRLQINALQTHLHVNVYWAVFTWANLWNHLGVQQESNDKENMRYTQNRGGFSHKEWSHVLCRKMNTMGGHIKWIKSVSCRQIVFPLVCFLHKYKKSCVYGRRDTKEDKGEGGVRKGLGHTRYTCIKVAF